MMSEELANEMEKTLRDLIINNSDLECDEDDMVMLEGVDDVDTFENKSICTKDRGLVIDFEDGSRVYLTIQAYESK